MKLFKLFFLLILLISAGCTKKGENYFKVGELVDKVTADENTWKGKEVIVSGYVSNTSGSESENGYNLNMTDHRNDESERRVYCKISQKNLPEGIESKTIEVKGKIGSVTRRNYLNMKTVTLESCEIIK